MIVLYYSVSPFTLVATQKDERGVRKLHERKLPSWLMVGNANVGKGLLAHMRVVQIKFGVNHGFVTWQWHSAFLLINSGKRGYVHLKSY